MTAPTTQAEQEDAVREEIARAICVIQGLDPDWDYDPRGISGAPGENVRWRMYLPTTDAILRGPLATLRTERDQLAADLRKAREALAWALLGRNWHGYALTPDLKDAGGTAKGDDHGA